MVETSCERVNRALHNTMGCRLESSVCPWAPLILSYFLRVEITLFSHLGDWLLFNHLGEEVKTSDNINMLVDRKCWS